MNRIDFIKRARALADRPDLDAAPPAPPPDPASRLERAGVPERLLSASLDNWQAEDDRQRETLARIRAFAAAPGDRWMAFLGLYGTGKTHLAVGCIRAAGGRYTTARALVQRIMASTSRWEERDRYVGTRLLVVDELPAGPLKDHEYEILYDIMDARYCAKRPCVLIANAMIDAFRATLRPALVDRFREVGTVEVFDWESWRGKA